MRIRQKGAAVGLSRTIGGAFLLLCLITIIGVLASIPMVVADKQSNLETLAATMGLPLILAAGLAWIGSFYYTMFPDIEVSDEGIAVRVVVSKRYFPWADIEGIAETRRIPRARVIVLRRKGLFLNQLHGLFYAALRDKPVILVSSKAENVQQLFQILEAKLKSP